MPIDRKISARASASRGSGFMATPCMCARPSRCWGSVLPRHPVLTLHGAAPPQHRNAVHGGASRSVTRQADDCSKGGSITCGSTGEPGSRKRIATVELHEVPCQGPAGHPAPQPCSMFTARPWAVTLARRGVCPSGPWTAPPRAGGPCPGRNRGTGRGTRAHQTDGSRSAPAPQPSASNARTTHQPRPELRCGASLPRSPGPQQRR
jgi:hypothetical protein